MMQQIFCLFWMLSVASVSAFVPRHYPPAFFFPRNISARLFSSFSPYDDDEYQPYDYQQNYDEQQYQPNDDYQQNFDDDYPQNYDDEQQQYYSQQQQPYEDDDPQYSYSQQQYSQDYNDPYQYNEPQQEEQELVLGNDAIEEQMRSLQSKFPTSEADYLAAARKRAEEARASVNGSASDEEWQAMAAQKVKQDDWESSLKEADNQESQILIPKGITTGEEDDGDEEEPKLLLF